MKYSLRRLLPAFAIAVALQLATSSAARCDLLGYWPIEAGEGEVVENTVNSDANGMIGNPDNGLGEDGSVWVNDPERGVVLSFDGSAEGAYVLAGEIPRMTFDNDFTWAFWTNQDAENTTPNDIVLGNRRNVDQADFAPRQFIKFTPTKFEYHMNGNGNDNLEYDDITPDEWLHHAVVKDGASLTYYRNGVEGESKEITQELDVAQPLFFGGDNTSSAGENWRGYIDDIAIWNDALPADRIAGLAAGGGVIPIPDGATLGDFNSDGDINVDDFMIMVQNFNESFSLEEAFSKGDMNGNLTVDLRDFSDFRELFNSQPAGAAAASSVPEPGTGWVVALSPIALLVLRRRRS